jgi:hypothetical protein
MFLDVLANHEAFLVDWKFSGPARGVGARAEARASAPMSQDWTDFEVAWIESARAERLIPPSEERNARSLLRLRYH